MCLRLSRSSLIICLLSTVVINAADSVPNQVIARFDPYISRLDLQQSLPDIHIQPVKLLVPTLNIWLLDIDPAETTVLQAIDQLKSRPEVRYAQENHLVELRQDQTFPDDPQFGSMWDMHNTGQSGGVVDADIDGPEAWSITTGGINPLGEELVVAVVDGGVDIYHEDLVDNIWVNVHEIPGNGVDDDNNGYIDDVNGWDAYSSDGSIPSNSHGTHVAGTAGATGNNSTDVVGVNWSVKIMAIAGSSGNTSVVAEAYGYALAQKQLYVDTDGEYGANVVSTNSSFGVNYADCNSGSYPIWNDLYNAMGAVGILSAAATMNINVDVDITGDVPTGCDSPFMVAVTNTTQYDTKNGGAAYGATTIDLGAPGTNICSTIPGGGVSCSYTGTSMATPHVAGAVAFLHAAGSEDLADYFHDEPDSAALTVKQMLLDGTDILPDLEGITVSGGRLNLYNSALIAEEFDRNLLPMLGDVNEDDVINVLDIVRILRFILGLATPDEREAYAADYNQDGEISVLDIIQIIDYILNGGGSVPKITQAALDL